MYLNKLNAAFFEVFKSDERLTHEGITSWNSRLQFPQQDKAVFGHLSELENPIEIASPF